MDLRAFRYMVIRRYGRSISHSSSSPKGVTHVYLVTIGERDGHSHRELVTDHDELHEAVQAIEAGVDTGEHMPRQDAGVRALEK